MRRRIQTCANICNMKDTEGRVDWRVEGSNWIWRVSLGKEVEADEVATRAVEDISRWVRGDGPILGMLEIRGDEAPKVGLIMMVSTSEMKSMDEHLVVLSSSVMANAGMHRAANSLKGDET